MQHLPPPPVKIEEYRDRAARIIGASLDVDASSYFDIHHTHADTFDKVKPQELATCVAAMAVMAYVVADMPGRL